MRFSPGCLCCGPDFPTSEDCCGFELIASVWEFEFTTITGDVHTTHLTDCLCSNMNRVYEVDSGGGCSWSLIGGHSFCSDGVLVTMLMACVGDTMFLQITIRHDIDIFTTHVDVVVYSLALASFDPLGPNDLNFVSHTDSIGNPPINGCSGFPDPLTITPV